jgi:prepilin peptidase CpaA
MRELQTVVVITLGMTLICAYTDLKVKKIYNVVTLPMILLGMIYHIAIEGGVGFLFSLLGIIVTLPLLLLFSLRMLGAGDIKLFMALGAWWGMEALLQIGLYSLMVAGIMAFVIMLLRGNVKERFKVLWTYFLSVLLLRKGLEYQVLSDAKSAHFPLAPAIALGLLIYVGCQS